MFCFSFSLFPACGDYSCTYSVQLHHKQIIVDAAKSVKHYCSLQDNVPPQSYIL